MTAPTSAPVSTALEADLRTWVRRQGIVLWLDADAHYTAVVHRLAEARAAGALPYDVFTYTGSHLALMLALEPRAAGLDKPQLVVHLPGFDEDAVRQTPLFELYAAGVRYRKSLTTLVTEAAAGQVRPEQIAAFLGQTPLTLERADAWLDALVSGATTGLSVQLRALSVPALIDDLLSGGHIARQVTDLDLLWEHLGARLGVTPEWRRIGVHTVADVAFAAASWALCVEYVHDLKRDPVSARLAGMQALPGPVRDACCALAVHLRAAHPGFYERTADETEAWIADEAEVAVARDLGKIDTFRFEEDRVLTAAIAAVHETESWAEVDAWCTPRTGGGSFWLRADAARRNAWWLLSDAARLGAALVAAGPGLPKEATLEEAVGRYVSHGAAVDLAHRQLEQRRTALLYPQLPEYQALRAALDHLRTAWRRWADDWTRDTARICRTHGFLPSPGLQQRTLFDDVVRPFTREVGTTAYFLIDAFRYEMGTALALALQDTPATTVTLRARLAELPTVTEVGMNVLAPVVTAGKLRPVLSGTNLEGFARGSHGGGYRVFDPDSRRRAMQDRVGGATCPGLKLAEVLARDVTGLKRTIAQATLLVVHSEEIDQAGENGVGTAVFDTILQKLRGAWQLLREAGVRRFVFTADHGFLLLDDSTIEKQAHGRKVDPKRRHVLRPDAVDRPNEVRVALADLGYEDAPGHLVFPDSTAVFDTGNRSMSFVHGGNSLQERVIPVLTVVHRAAAGADTLHYAVRATVRDPVAGMHCIEVRVETSSQGGLDFGGVREVELALRVVDDADVQVELCQARGARLEAGVAHAKVGAPFELFFRLLGPVDDRVRVALHSPTGSAAVEPCAVDGRFDVSLRPGTPVAPPERVSAPREWSSAFTDPGVRQVFEHLDAHGSVTEVEVATMLGGPRQLRRFANQFEALAKLARFRVRIDVVGGVKRYVREGSE